MTWLRRLRFRTLTLFGRTALEQQLDEELQFHLEMQTSANIQMGMPPVAAHALARQQFGSLTQHKEDYRDRWGARHAEIFCQDIRTGIRHAWSRAGTSFAIITVLALGLGAGIAVFSVFHAVLLQPLPYADAERLVRVQARGDRNTGERLFSAPEVRDLRAFVPSLDGVAEFHFMYFIVLDGQDPRRVSAGVVSSNFFDVIGVSPALGRTFTPEEEQVGAPGAIVLSHRFWKEQLGGDAHAIGRVFQMNDRTHRVVGVLPPLPDFPEEADIYLPTAACPLRMSVQGDQDRTMHLVSALARLSRRGDWDRTQVTRDLDELADRMRRLEPAAYLAGASPSLSIVPVQDDLTAGFRPTLAVLVSSTTFLLLSLCSSVGALMVANMLRRRENVALMVALGAWKGRLFRQFATEALVLASLGAAAGLGLAYAGLPVFVALASRFTSRASEIHLDLATLLFAGALTVVVSLLLGAIMTVTAASWLTEPDVIGQSRSATARRPLFRGLIVLHIAVSFALLVGAGLMLRSVLNLQRVDPGYQSRNVLTMRVSADFIEFPSFEARSGLFHRILQSIQSLPGVDSAAISGALPLADSGNLGEDIIEAGGARAGDGQGQTLASMQVISSDYFHAVGVRLLEGRTFTPGDGLQAPRVAIVNRSMARRQWGEVSAVGQRIKISQSEWVTVVGVVADARQRLADTVQDEVFRPMLQLPLVQDRSIVQARFFVRSAQPVAWLEDQIRLAVRRVSPRQPIDSFQTLESTREQSLVPMRLTALLVVLFAVIALAISAVGIGGVVGASVAMRIRAFGLQMALGATRGCLLRSVLREGAALSVSGLLVGLALALALSRALGGLLFEVSRYDLTTFAFVAGLLLAVTLGACVAPARRAARVDPNVALRA